MLKANQPVIELDRISLKAELTRLEARFNALNALKIRLDAERFGGHSQSPFQAKSGEEFSLRGAFSTASSRSAIKIRGNEGSSLELATTIEAPKIAVSFDGLEQNKINLIEGQDRAYASGRQLLSTEVQALEKKILGLQKQRDGILARVASQKSLLSLSERELRKMKPLAANGYIARNRLNEREKTVLELRGQVEANVLEASGISAQIEELKLQIKRTKVASSDVASKEYTRIVGELAEISDQLVAARRHYSDSVVRAPFSGRLTNLSVATVGGVLAGGDVVGEIVPENSPLMVEARVDPDDIDYVKIGQSANIVITAFDRQLDDTFSGSVAYISADSNTEDKTGDTYFVVRLAFNRSLMKESNRLSDLVPGMQTEVYIQTGSRTFVSYLFKPISRSFQRSFKEQ